MLPEQQYEYVNSKGVTYYLRKTSTRLKYTTKEYVAYFFTKTKDFSKGEPCALPEDRTVVENPHNGALFLKKK